MSELKPFKKALIGSTALIGASVLASPSALAASCPVTINGNTLAGTVCSFDANNSVTVANGAEVAEIDMFSYNPANSFILNNGLINNGAGSGIVISSASLTNGITNNGTINTTSGNGIDIVSNANISGGISNLGTINSDLEGLRVVGSSTVSGGISNIGSIISGSANDVAIVIGFNSVVNDGIDNDGLIRATGIGDAMVIYFSSTVAGGIDNSGTIRGGGGGLSFRTSVLSGGITNSGMITGDANHGINITNASTINGNITNTGTITGGNAGISVNNTSTITGAISNAGTIIGSNYGVYVTSAAIIGGITNSGTIQGGTNAIYIDNGSNVSDIDLLAGSRVIGAIDAVNTDVNINADFTSEGTISANNVNINSGNVFRMANAVTVQSELINVGTLAIGTATRTLTGNYTQSTGGILKIGVQNTGAYGQLASTGAIDLSQSGAIDVDVVSGANIAVGDAFTGVVSGVVFTAPGGGYTVTDNSRLLNFTAATNGNALDLTAITGSTVSASNLAAGNLGGTGAALALDRIIALNPAGDWQNVIGALNTLSTDQQVATAVNQAAPALIGATPAAIIETMGAASRFVQARQESNSGLSSGDDFQTNRNFWLKTFGSWGDQGNTNGVAGYDSESYGLIAGADKAITDKARLGVGASYFNSDLKSDGDYHKVNVDSYLGMVYGSYSLDDRTDVNAQLEAGYNSSDSKRIINFGGLNRIADGNYGGWNLHAGTGVGRSLNAGNDTTITPQVRLDYFVVHNESYNETGAGVLNLNVGSQTQDQLIPAVEVKANHKLTPRLSLAANGGLGYDVLNDHNTVSAGFAGGGGVFVTRGLAPSPWIVRSGLGLTWKQSDTLDLTARYDRSDRGSDYDDQAVSLKLRMLF